MSDPHHTPVSGAWTTESTARADRYERLGLLGEGGMGSVWRARDKALNRDVAYKTVSPDAPQDVRKRLIQEARIAANLAGTGCISVFDHGTSADGRPYYTMELLTFPAFRGDRDSSLRQLLDVATTLGAAHSRGIVHRDIKPTNVGLAGTRAVLADWGLARPVEAVSEWDQSILTQARPRTSTGLAMGTAGYMAPEQLTGAPASVRADVWSLGAMLYDLIADETLRRQGQHQLMSRVVAGTLELPKSPLGALAASALALDPAQRPPDAAAFAAVLRTCMEPRVQRSRSWPMWMAVGVAALVIGGVFGWASVPDYRQQASDSSSALGWIHMQMGRRLQAQDWGQQALEAGTSSATRGLATVPVSHGPQPSAYPADCPRWVLDTVASGAVCVRPTSLSLYDSDGGRRWEVPANDAYDVRLSSGIVTFVDAFSNQRVLADGSVERMMYSSTERMIHRDEAWFFKVARSLLVAPTRESRPAVVAENVNQLVGAIDGASVTMELGKLVWRRDGEKRQVTIDQLVVAMRAAADTVWVVGERGVVVELDRQTWSERERYLLPGPGEVLSAALGPDGEVAWSSRSGVMRAVHGVVTDQLTTHAVSELSVDTHGRVWGVTEGKIWRWESSETSRHVYPPFSTSTMDLHHRGTLLMIGTGDGRAIALDPSSGETSERSYGRDHVQSLFRTQDAMYLVHGTELIRAVTPPVVYPNLRRATALADGSIVGVARGGPGVGWIVDGQLHFRTDTETFRAVRADISGEFAIAQTDSGNLWRIDADHTLTPLGVEDVSLFTSCEVGLVIARGSVVSLGEGPTVDVGEPVTALYGDRQIVAVGTLQGTVVILSHAGVELARLHAHGERVSVIARFDESLFTGSWEPGVRRWELNALLP